MRKGTLLLIILALSSCRTTEDSSAAGFGECKGNVKLTCATFYVTENQSAEDGPESSADVVDTQPEYFDPARCEAYVNLATRDGNFESHYQESTGTLLALFAANGKKTEIINQVLDVGTSVEAAVNSGKTKFVCQLSTK